MSWDVLSVHRFNTNVVILCTVARGIFDQVVNFYLVRKVGCCYKNVKWLKAYLLFIGAEAGAGEKKPGVGSATLIATNKFLAVGIVLIITIRSVHSLGSIDLNVPVRYHQCSGAGTNNLDRLRFMRPAPAPGS